MSFACIHPWNGTEDTPEFTGIPPNVRLTYVSSITREQCILRELHDVHVVEDHTGIFTDTHLIQLGIIIMHHYFGTLGMQSPTPGSTSAPYARCLREQNKST